MPTGGGPCALGGLLYTGKVMGAKGFDGNGWAPDGVPTTSPRSLKWWENNN